MFSWVRTKLTEWEETCGGEYVLEQRLREWSSTGAKKYGVNLREWSIGELWMQNSTYRPATRIEFLVLVWLSFGDKWCQRCQDFSWKESEITVNMASITKQTSNLDQKWHTSVGKIIPSFAKPAWSNTSARKLNSSVLLYGENYFTIILSFAQAPPMMPAIGWKERNTRKSENLSHHCVQFSPWCVSKTVFHSKRCFHLKEKELLVS